MCPDNLDEVIEKYSRVLIEMGATYGGEVPEKESAEALKTKNEEVSQKEDNDLPKKENPLIPPEMSEKEEETEPPEEVDTEPAVKPPSVTLPEGNADSFAQFFARVFTGEGAYPVKGAKVVIYRGDNIYAFLETDSNGSTKKVKLPSFSKENSLEPENENQSIEYNADVFANGFTTQKGLLVSAVGGSEIVLNVLLVPEEERLN